MWSLNLRWSLSLAERATYPVATAHPNAAARRRRGASTQLLRIASLLAVFFLPAAAHAVSGQAAIVMQKWKSMDSCAAAAQRAFPDFSAESNARRDALLKECLAGQNLPPRETASPAR